MRSLCSLVQNPIFFQPIQCSAPKQIKSVAFAATVKEREQSPVEKGSGSEFFGCEVGLDVTHLYHTHVHAHTYKHTL